MSTELSQSAFEPHDHSRCAKHISDNVAAVCEERGLRLTELRKDVLEMLSDAHLALGAYDIVERLREKGKSAAPPVAYRALSFLVENGFAHRIESMNAYVACCSPEADHHPAFLICTTCKSVEETSSEKARAALKPTIGARGFVIERSVLEILGTCPPCITENARG